MAKNTALPALAMLCIMAITAVTAANDEPPQMPSGELAITLYAKDSTNFEALKNKQVAYTATNAAGEKQAFNEKTNENASATIYLDTGQYLLHAEIDDEFTKGKDYAAAITIKVQKDETQRILFQPVSSASLLAVNQENQVIPNARVEINCVKDLYPPTELNEISEFTADASGALFIKFLPTGSCQITAKYGEKTTVQTIESTTGEYKQITLALSQAVNKTNDYTQILAALAVLAFLALIAAPRFYSKKPAQQPISPPQKPTPTHRPKLLTQQSTSHTQQPASAHHSPPQKQRTVKEPARQQQFEEKNTRLKDILETLKPREKQIIDILIRSKEKAKQADIYRETLIPKATLSRTLEELQKKNIVKITPFGKINHVELSKWVLERE